MTDRAVALPAPPGRRRLGRATRLAVAGTFAGLMALALGLAWLQVAVLSGLPSREELQDLGAAARARPAPAAAPSADPALADRTAGLLLATPTPALKRELQQRLLAMRLRGVLSPDEIGRVYAAAAEPPPAPSRRPPPPPAPTPRPIWRTGPRACCCPRRRRR